MWPALTASLGCDFLCREEAAVAVLWLVLGCGTKKQKKTGVTPLARKTLGAGTDEPMSEAEDSGQGRR